MTTAGLVRESERDDKPRPEPVPRDADQGAVAGAQLTLAQSFIDDGQCTVYEKVRCKIRLWHDKPIDNDVSCDFGYETTSGFVYLNSTYVAGKVEGSNRRVTNHLARVIWGPPHHMIN